MFILYYQLKLDGINKHLKHQKKEVKNMIKIVQWGSSRSLCKVYNKDVQGNFESVTLMLVDNDYLVNLETHVTVLDYPIK